MADKEMTPSPWRPGMPLLGREYTAVEVKAPWEKGENYEFINPKAWFLMLRDEMPKKTLDDLKIAVDSAYYAGYIVQNQAFALRANISNLYELMGYSLRRRPS
jgi:hypothetical protein